jgi:hypothetical protein
MCVSCENLGFGGMYRFHRQGECIVSIVRVKRVIELGTTLVVTSFHLDGGGNNFLCNFRFLQELRRHIPEHDILHSHCLENFKSYLGKH